MDTCITDPLETLTVEQTARNAALLHESTYCGPRFESRALPFTLDLANGAEKIVDSQVSLERWDGAWVAEAGRKTDLNDKLKAMLGMSADEFSKIVVLPQGDFQQFLEATSGERETMLAKLFPVDADRGAAVAALQGA